MEILPATSSGAELSPSLAMLQMIAGFRISRAIYVAAKLGIADLLKDGPLSSEELAQRTGTHALSLYRVMRALASASIFAENDQHQFVLNPLAATLGNDVPGSLRAWAIASLGDEGYQTWGDLMYSVRTGEIAFDHVFGTGVWQYRAQHPEDARVFDEAMANTAKIANAAVLNEYSFSGFNKIVDVGGGDGGFLIDILTANPNLKGVLIDLPHVAEKAKRRIVDAGLTGRCEVVGGDIFTSVPPGGCGYVLSRVVNSFDNERSITILKTCRQAMGVEAKLILVQRVLPDRAESSSIAQTVYAIDLQMMVTTGGRERTVTEHRELLAAAGFQITRIVRTQSEMSVVECVPV